MPFFRSMQLFLLCALVAFATSRSLYDDDDDAVKVHEAIKTTGTGVRTVLAIRVKTLDRQTTSNLNQIRNKIFGTNGDEVNLVERYNSCSFGQLVMQPYMGDTTKGVSISNGVYEVDVQMNAAGEDHNDIRKAAITIATTRLGNLEDQFDHVMFCLPPGTAGGWNAYGKFYF
jgi:hypothetical protein